MAFDGVFAFQGKDHITASQLGRIVEGVAGKGRYVLPTLNQMTAEMQTANKVRVGTGDLVMDGRVVTNEAAVDLTVESGTSGYKRNDLVVCRYTKNASTGVENFAAEVVKGTPTTGTAADPEVTEGDISTGSASAVMPLWRIPLDGITPGAPVRVAPVASTLKTLGDSVSQTKTFSFTSPYMETRGQSDTPVTLKVCGNVCTLYVNGTTTQRLGRFAELLDSASLKVLADYVPREFDADQQYGIANETEPAGCRLNGMGPHLWLTKNSPLDSNSEMRFVFSWVR